MPAPRAQHPDDTQKAKVGDQYAARHNPFVYFHCITDSPACAATRRRPRALTTDLASAATTPNLTYITPEPVPRRRTTPLRRRPARRSGHRRRVAADLGPEDPRLPGFQQDGVLVITFDEADGPQSDADACCGEGPGPNAPLPGISGLGGGRIGALLISPVRAARHLVNDTVQPLLAARHDRGHLRAARSATPATPGLDLSASTSTTPESDRLVQGIHRLRTAPAHAHGGP